MNEGDRVKVTAVGRWRTGSTGTVERVYYGWDGEPAYVDIMFDNGQLGVKYRVDEVEATGDDQFDRVDEVKEIIDD